MNTPTIRPAEQSDLAAIAAIYAHYVDTSFVTFDEHHPTPAEWTVKLERARESGWPFLVAEDDSAILGYALLQPFRGKSGWRFAAENSIYLAPQAAGRGLGRILLDALIAQGATAGVRSIVAVITDQGTEASIALHTKAGFVPAGKLDGVGWKNGRQLGVYLMTRHLHEPQTASDG